MRSQLCFVMHPIDEQEFASQVLSEESVLLIDGPRWKTATPETYRSLERISGDYCIIWSTRDCATLQARHVSASNDWYCESEFTTIQFLRSQVFDSVITEGRIAVSTSNASETEARGVEGRFKALVRYVKKHYTNSVLSWSNPSLPFAPAGEGRSGNPGKPDARIWVGPHALRWLEQDRARCVKQSKSSLVEARLAETAA
jgi:hypothetical protein